MSHREVAFRWTVIWKSRAIVRLLAYSNQRLEYLPSDKSVRIEINAAEMIARGSQERRKKMNADESII
jgi:catabolite regulation protein CreA